MANIHRYYDPIGNHETVDVSEQNGKPKKSLEQIRDVQREGFIARELGNGDAKRGSGLRANFMHWMKEEEKEKKKKKSWKNIDEWNLQRKFKIPLAIRQKIKAEMDRIDTVVYETTSYDDKVFFIEQDPETGKYEIKSIAVRDAAIVAANEAKQAEMKAKMEEFRVKQGWTKKELEDLLIAGRELQKENF